jgi:hypothetical protein
MTTKRKKPSSNLSETEDAELQAPISKRQKTSRDIFKSFTFNPHQWPFCLCTRFDQVPSLTNDRTFHCLVGRKGKEARFYTQMQSMDTGFFKSHQDLLQAIRSFIRDTNHIHLLEDMWNLCNVDIDKIENGEDESKITISYLHAITGAAFKISKSMKHHELLSFFAHL